jgi:tRNA A-37 threonylcarbamoyl transferase component Bud32
MAHQVIERLQHALADRYLLDREIGHGGMATVYLAQDLRHGRRVAVKVLRPELAAYIGPERFLREIRTTANLTHPNILPLHDSGSADGLLYYVMPYVEGDSLRDRITIGGPLPLADACRITAEVADALEYAHGQGLVHRDVKPANILLAGEHALVADFGLATAGAGAPHDDEASRSGFAVGTAEYMSPEQASGSRQVDGRADVYALGCVLYEMLAGEPPFTGSTTHAILARQRSEPPPSLLRIRPDLPPWVEEVVRRALSKVPADRYQRAADLRQAVLAGGRAEGAGPSRRQLGVLVAGLLVVAVALWAFVPRHPPTDRNKVVVFPLVERGGAVPPGLGQEIALMIGSALEHTEPLKWIDGWTWLDSARRGDVSLLPAGEAARIARARGARYYVDGAVVGSADSSRVILRLNDVRGDSVLAQATVAGDGLSGSLVPLGLRAVSLLLPPLLQPGRQVDLAPLEGRHPAAIANWLQGEREYRRAHYASALAHQRRAVEADSSLAFAALKGALAAEWEHQYEEAGRLVDLALRDPALLPPKYLHFANGLRAYYANQAEPAAREFGEAIRRDSTWTEAWMGLGEVRYHLMIGAESLAAEAFQRARRSDPGFAPALFHLAELALLGRRTGEAAALVADFRRTEPDSAWLAQLELALDCMQRGPAAVDWAGAVAAHPFEVVYASKVLAAAGASTGCAEAGFRALFTSTAAPTSPRWGAVLGLQGLLTARGKLGQVRALLDSAVATGLPAANGLYVVHAVQGDGMDDRAGGVIASLAGDYGGMSAARLWYHGVWEAHRGNREAVRAVVAALARRAAASRDPFDVATRRAIEARALLLDGDTAAAIALLEQVTPAGSGAEIEWGMVGPFGAEQLLLAELLLARGRPADAQAVAARFDHGRSIIHLTYLRRSLALRVRAAEALGREEVARGHRARLARLDAE